MTVDVLTGESCLLTLNYAYYHVIACLLQAAVMYVGKKTDAFPTAHAFGLFALVMDYALNFLTTGTRTLSYPYQAENLDKGIDSGDEPMGPVGTFFFFLWFDYSAFGIILWALSTEQHLRTCFSRGCRRAFLDITQDPAEVFNLAIVPLQFWTAPWLSSHLGIDNRTLILQRSSSKLSYMIMVGIFPLLLRYAAGLTWIKGIFPIVLAGFGCGLIHHAALWTSGMRGYGNIRSLALTLISEWPALITGLAVVHRLGWPCIVKVLPFLTGAAEPRREPVNSCHESQQESSFKSSRAGLQCTALIQSSASSSAATSSLDFSFPRAGRGTSLFTVGMWLALLALLYPHLASINEKDAVSYLIPYIPGQRMQSLGTAFLRTRTCIVPRTLAPVSQLARTVYRRFGGSEEANCWPEIRSGRRGDTAQVGRDMLVMASAAKSGAVLSARIVAEVGGSVLYWNHDLFPI